MDAIDKIILNLLKENSRTTASQISKRVNLSIPAVSERIRKLDEMKLIEQYTIKINRRQMGHQLLVAIFVTLDHTAHINQFRTQIISYPEVLECHHTIGEYDYMLKVLLNDSEELESFISDKLKTIPGIQRTNTILLLSTLKEEINR
jgi:Lrp/AsnC family leucine-responsive transcriptional regulator